MADKIRVLLLATNQMELSYVSLGEDLREIEDKIQAGPFRDSFDPIPKPAVRLSDLGAFLLRHEPHIVYFSGHGRLSKGITLEDDYGKIKRVRAEQLTGIFRTLKGRVRLVFFNACHTSRHAESITEVIDYAVGMNGTIKDEAAIAFAGSFFQTLAFGRSVKEAFEVAVNISGLTGSKVPALTVREGANDSEPFINPEYTDGLQPIVSRLIDGKANEDDRLVIQRGVARGKIVLDEIEDLSATRGSAKRYLGITSRGGQLHVGLSPSAYQNVNEMLFPAPPGIPPPLPHSIFIGREDALEDVKELLGNTNESITNSKITVVRGWPGVGKTTLVGVIGRDQGIAKMFPQGVLWTSLEEKPNLLSELARWGRKLGTDEIFRIPTLKEATARLAALLRARRLLLILDDLWDAAHAVPFLEAIGEQCALMITTRMTSVAEALTPNKDRIYVLPVLTEENALKLLRILVPSIVERHEDECRELVRDLECLPLALHVAGNLLRSEADMGWGVTDLIQEIREGARLIPLPAPKDRIEGEKIPTVSALLMKSTDKLDTFTRECFAFLGAFPARPATFDLMAVKEVWQVDDPRPIVRNLVGHGLLEPVGSGRFQMHRLLVDHARSLCEQ